MSHPFVTDSSPAMRAAKRALIGAALVAIGYIAALLASPSVAMLSGPEGNVSDAGAAAPPSFAHIAPTKPASTRRMQQDFDYFPDHYINQAREAAEQPPTF
jgi:hypothetical protein